MKRLQKHIYDLMDELRTEAATQKLARNPASINCLIVEDDEMDATLSMAAVGSVGGVEAILAKSGDDAMSLLASSKLSGSPFDIAFIDLKLVGSNAQGTDLIDKIRRDFPRTHIVIVTGTLGQDATHFLASEAQRGSYVGIVHKPLQAENLEEILAKHRMRK